MPQPIRKGKFTVDPESLADRPELSCQIAIIACHWSEIEDELAFIFAHSMQTHPVLAASVLGRVSNLKTRLDMIESAISLSFPEPALRRFQNDLRDRIGRAFKSRTTIVHGLWRAHPEYPDHLIRTAGSRDPALKIMKYDAKDFLEIRGRLYQLHIDLRLFAESLVRDYEIANPPKSGWQIDGDTPADEN